MTDHPFLELFAEQTVHDSRVSQTKNVGFSNVPACLFFNIMRCLCVKDFLSCSETCKSLWQLCHDPTVREANTELGRHLVERSCLDSLSPETKLYLDTIARCRALCSSGACDQQALWAFYCFTEQFARFARAANRSSSRTRSTGDQEQTTGEAFSRRGSNSSLFNRTTSPPLRPSSGTRMSRGRRHITLSGEFDLYNELRLPCRSKTTQWSPVLTNDKQEIWTYPFDQGTDACSLVDWRRLYKANAPRGRLSVWVRVRNIDVRLPLELVRHQANNIGGITHNPCTLR